LEAHADSLCRSIASQLAYLAARRPPQDLWEQAQDVLQDAAVEAIGSAVRFRHGSRVRPWLMRIALNIIRNRFRRNRRDAQVRPFSALPDGGAAAPERRDATAHADAALDYATIRAAMPRLGARGCEALERRFIDGLDGDDLARALGVSRSAARVRVYRALRELQSVFSRGDE
jgi:RNA polymerase sigma-70 factor (ECF subfamily)